MADWRPMLPLLTDPPSRRSMIHPLNPVRAQTKQMEYRTVMHISSKEITPKDRPPLSLPSTSYKSHGSPQAKARPNPYTTNTAKQLPPPLLPLLLQLRLRLLPLSALLGNHLAQVVVVRPLGSDALLLPALVEASLEVLLADAVILVQ